MIDGVADADDSVLVSAKTGHSAAGDIRVVVDGCVSGWTDKM